jgi:enhancing lycopene biosynthesis protein 2
MKKVAVILSGCGFLDGAEITEAISTLIAIGQNGAEYKVFAPNKDVPETNHLTQKPTGEKRNVLQESARIARGDIQSLEKLKAQDFDALAFPGGYGAALHLCNFAEKGSGGTD